MQGTGTPGEQVGSSEGAKARTWAPSHGPSVGVGSRDNCSGGGLQDKVASSRAEWEMETG